MGGAQRLSPCSLPHSKQGWSATQPPACLLPFSLPQHPPCHTKPHSGTAEVRGSRGLAPHLLQPPAGLWELSPLQLCPRTQGSQQREQGQPKGFAFPALLRLLQPPGISPVRGAAGRPRPHGSKRPEKVGCLGQPQVCQGHVTALRRGSCTRALPANKQAARGTALLLCARGQLYHAEGCWGITNGVCSSEAWLSQS